MLRMFYKQVSLETADAGYVRTMKRVLTLLLFGFLAAPASAHDPTVVDVKVEQVGMLWNIHVTVAHEDTGWDHFADGWEVQDVNGTVLAYRKLMHPHVNEQPFTRSLSGVVIPDGTREIFVRGHCNVGGWSTDLIKIDLSR